MNLREHFTQIFKKLNDWKFLIHKLKQKWSFMEGPLPYCVKHKHWPFIHPVTVVLPHPWKSLQSARGAYSTWQPYINRISGLLLIKSIKICRLVYKKKNSSQPLLAKCQYWRKNVPMQGTKEVYRRPRERKKEMEKRGRGVQSLSCWSYLPVVWFML